MKQFIYRDYKNFDNANFQMDLESKLNNCPKKYGNFEETFENALNAHAPKKTKFLRGNQKPNVDKNLCKAIMKCLQLKQVEQNNLRILLNIRHNEIWTQLNRESKTQYFDNIQRSKNSKPFWDKCNSYFSNKHDHGDSKIILIEKLYIITNKNEVVRKETLLINNDQ